MALQIWLPLLGNTNNQGLLPLSFTNTPASYGTGPLGQSATFTGSTANTIYNNDKTVHYTDNFSWAMWINTNYTGTAAQFAFTVGRADAGGFGYGLQCLSATTCRVRFGNKYYDIAVTGGEWTHLAFTKEGTSLKVYKNGVLLSTYTFDGTLPTYSDGYGLGIGAFHYSGNIYPFYGSICDFRIYDNVLSAKEVKEISKGLTIHLPLRGLDCNPNLVYNSQVWNNSVSIASGITRTTPTYDGITIQRFTTSKDITSGGFYTGVFSGNRWNGKKLTWSVEIRASKEFTIPTLTHERFGGTSAKVSTEWKKFTHTGTYGQTSYNAFCVYFNSSNPFPADAWLEFRNFKVEEGDKATPWCPNIYDSNYSRLGYGSYTTPYTLTGGPSNSQGYISGFATTKYINTNYTVPWNGASKWDMYLKFTTGSDVTTTQTLSNPVSGCSIASSISSGYFKIILGNGSWNILTADTQTFAVEASKTYYVKISFTGSAYTVSHSTTGFENVTLDYTLESTSKIANDGSARILGCNRASSFPFLGSIDMQEFKICLNGNPTYIGAVTPISTCVKDEASGYNRAVTLAGRVTPVYNTPKDYGVNFISGSKVTCASGFPTGNFPNFTVSMWLKPTSGSTFTAWCDYYGLACTNSSGGNSTIRLEVTGSSGTGINWFGPFAGSGGLFNLGVTPGTWHHIVWTSNGTTFTNYLNGVQKSTHTPSTDAYKTWAPTGNFYVGDGYGVYFDAADVRVYGTCLSATDIKKLYDTPIAIDNTNKLYCTEVVEE